MYFYFIEFSIVQYLLECETAVSPVNFVMRLSEICAGRQFTFSVRLMKLVGKY